MTTPPFRVTEKFGHVRMPVTNNLLISCMQIARLKNIMLDDAQAHHGYAHDAQGRATGLDTQRYAQPIKDIVELFGKINHGTVMYRYGYVMGRASAKRLNADPATAGFKHQWAQMDMTSRLKALRALSDVMIDEMQNSDPVFLFNKPVLKLSNLPSHADGAIAMQVQKYNAPAQTPGHDITLITVSRHTLQNTPYHQVASMLWHEHMHIYMMELRDCYQQGDIRQSHPLYEEAYRSQMIMQYKIHGNFGLSRAMYRAEPEEKLCYAVQDEFERTLSPRPQSPVLQVA